MKDALRACRRYFLVAAAFSLAINLLYLASPLYMLQIYDRVVTSGALLLRDAMDEQPVPQK